MEANRLGRTRQATAGETTTSEYGVLGGERAFRLDRYPPANDLGRWVERHWTVTWELPPGGRSAATLLPHPCVNLVFDGGRLMVAGVGRERFTYPLVGHGRVFGVKFRPGAFQPFLGASVDALTERTVPAAQVWGERATTLERELSAAGAAGELIASAEAFLRRLRPEPDPYVDLVEQVVRALLHDRSVTRVDDVARRSAVSMRTLQRLFKRYVGVSPKWVLRRYRLHEAAARLEEDASADWAEVAVELGYFDQPHFVRDFTVAVGMSPAAYAKACATGRAPVPA